MYEYHYDETDRAFYEAVYDVLVQEARAPNGQYDREGFVLSYLQIEYPATEYRFCGSLGFGGKFYRTGGRFYVSCYVENETPETLATIARVNARLNELVERFKPKLVPGSNVH